NRPAEAAAGDRASVTVSGQHIALQSRDAVPLARGGRRGWHTTRLARNAAPPSPPLRCPARARSHARTWAVSELDTDRLTGQNALFCLSVSRVRGGGTTLPRTWQRSTEVESMNSSGT